MKTPLIALILVGALWLAGLAFQSQIMSAFMLDAVLPPRVLAGTNAEERRQIEGALRKLSAPSSHSWVGALAVIALSGFALKKTSADSRDRG